MTCDALAETGLVRHGFSTRRCGVSTGRFASLNLGRHTEDDQACVLTNFSLFARDIGADVSKMVLPRQIHSTKVLSVTAEDAGKGVVRESDLPDADALLTNERGLCLATFYADCTPVLLFDPVKQVIGAVHSGWRGTLGQIAKTAVLAMAECYGSDPADVLAAMGPSIKRCHFEVDEDVYRLFLEQFGKSAEKHTIFRNQKYYIDTDAINIHSMQEAGVLASNISTCPRCTYCEQEMFFSHRREGSTGRMSAVIELL